MSKVQTLKVFVNQRLSAAAEEIFELFERTIAEYEEQLCRQNKLLDAVFKPEVRLHRADIQQLLANKEEVAPEQQELTSSPDRVYPAKLPHRKDQEKVWTNQEKKQLPVLVKGEKDEEEKPRSSQIHHTSQTELTQVVRDLKTKADGEDCGGPQAVWDLNPDRNLQSDTHDKKSNASGPETDDNVSDPEMVYIPFEPKTDDNSFEPEMEFTPFQPKTGYNTSMPEINYITLESETDYNAFEPDTDDSSDWEDTSGRWTCLSPLQQNELPESDGECDAGKTSNNSLECPTSFGYNGRLQTDSVVQTGAEPFSCSFCDKRFVREESLHHHMKLHFEGECLTCPVCDKTFHWRGGLETHMRVHTGEKPFSCSVCRKSFRSKSHVVRHMTIHTGEKPYSCYVCGKRYTQNSTLTTHLRLHTGEKPYTCLVCQKSFHDRGNWNKHMKVHTGEKPSSSRQ